MSNLTLLTVARKDVTVYDLINQYRIPSCGRKETEGRPSKLYSWGFLEREVQKGRDVALASKMSAGGQVKFLVGSVELEGTPEQKQIIRAVIDAKDREIADFRRTVTDLLRYVPDSHLTEHERAIKHAPTPSEYFAKFGIRF